MTIITFICNNILSPLPTPQCFEQRNCEICQIAAHYRDSSSNRAKVLFMGSTAALTQDPHRNVEKTSDSSIADLSFPAYIYVAVVAMTIRTFFFIFLPFYILFGLNYL